eukprot:475690_1
MIFFILCLILFFYMPRPKLAPSTLDRSKKSSSLYTSCALYTVPGMYAVRFTLSSLSTRICIFINLSIYLGGGGIPYCWGGGGFPCPLFGGGPGGPPPYPPELGGGPPAGLPYCPDPGGPGGCICICI